MLNRLLTCLFTYATVSMLTAEESVYAHCRSSEVSETEAGALQPLFEHYFGSSMQQTREQWDAERGAYYFAFRSRDKGNTTVLHECIWLLSADGTTLRYLTCQKRENGTRFAYTERVQKAVAPYLFVKWEETAAYFSRWSPEPDARNTIRVEQMCARYQDYASAARTTTEEEKALVLYYIHRMPQNAGGAIARWDAEKKVLWRARVEGAQIRGGLYVFSEDEKTLCVIAASWDGRELRAGMVTQYRRLAPGLYAAVKASRIPEHGDFAVLVLAQDPQTGHPMIQSSHQYTIPIEE